MPDEPKAVTRGINERDDPDMVERLILATQEAERATLRARLADPAVVEDATAAALAVVLSRYSSCAGIEWVDAEAMIRAALTKVLEALDA